MTTTLPHEIARTRTETETALASIWAEVLNLETVGIDDDFFELGGHSLLAVRVISRIRDVLGVDLETPLLLFEHPTIAGLASVLTELDDSTGGAEQIEPRDRREPAPASFVQEQLWFLDQLAPGSPVYNIVDVVRIDGEYDASANDEDGGGTGASPRCIPHRILRDERATRAARLADGQCRAARD